MNHTVVVGTPVHHNTLFDFKLGGASFGLCAMETATALLLSSPRVRDVINAPPTSPLGNVELGITTNFQNIYTYLNQLVANNTNKFVQIHQHLHSYFVFTELFQQRPAYRFQSASRFLMSLLEQLPVFSRSFCRLHPTRSLFQSTRTFHSKGRLDERQEPVLELMPLDQVKAATSLQTVLNAMPDKFTALPSILFVKMETSSNRNVVLSETLVLCEFAGESGVLCKYRLSGMILFDGREFISMVSAPFVTGSTGAGEWFWTSDTEKRHYTNFDANEFTDSWYMLRYDLVDDKTVAPTTVETTLVQQHKFFTSPRPELRREREHIVVEHVFE